MKRKAITFRILNILEVRFFQNRVIDYQRKPHPNRSITHLLTIHPVVVIINSTKITNL